MDLYLLRHAKSSWDDARRDDHDRPLSPRGERAAALMGAYLAQRDAVPSLVLCSSARRTVETWERVSAQLPRRPEVRISRDLYLASAARLLEQLRQIEDPVGEVLLIGHNPGIHEIATQLASVGDAAALRRMRGKFPTAGLAWLRFDATRWSDLPTGNGELRAFATPKDLV